MPKRETEPVVKLARRRDRYIKQRGYQSRGILCLECPTQIDNRYIRVIHREFHDLGTHIRRAHNLTGPEYLERHGLPKSFNLTSPEYGSRLSGSVNQRINRATHYFALNGLFTPGIAAKLTGLSRETFHLAIREHRIEPIRIPRLIDPHTNDKVANDPTNLIPLETLISFVQRIPVHQRRERAITKFLGFLQSNKKA